MFDDRRFQGEGEGGLTFVVGAPRGFPSVDTPRSLFGPGEAPVMQLAGGELFQNQRCSRYTEPEVCEDHTY